MDMVTQPQDQVVFHMTGKPAGDGVLPLNNRLRPALLAPYADLTALRYDFPLVLRDDVEQPAAQPHFVASLSALTSEVLGELAPRGPEGERLRRHVLRLEREIRALLHEGSVGRLSELWTAAAERVGQADDPEVAQVLSRIAGALHVDGELLDCGARMPARFVHHAWLSVQAEKARAFHAQVDTLVRKLSDIQRAALMRSAAGQQPAALRSAMGAPHADSFDFEAMSRLVTRSAPQEDLPPARRRRIAQALEVLRGQRFFPRSEEDHRDAFVFEFTSCASAAAAYRIRMPHLVELVKATAIAELEATGRYVESDHDPFFERYDAETLTAADLALFPDYLVTIPADRSEAPENAGLLGLLSAGLPLKVLVEAIDLLEDGATGGAAQFAFGVRSTRLATTAMGLGGMFVLQSTSSNLYALRERVRHGMRCSQPALFCVYPGTDTPATDLPAYLVAAAAMQGRAFPAFSYDAAAGENWASRFCLENNREPDRDWPQDDLAYEDENLQRESMQTAFTFADFALCDRRYARHFALVPRSRWSPAMVPVAQWLELPEAQQSDRIPYVLAVDAEAKLQRVIVDQRLMQATRRCQLLWRRLQEHAGINDAYANALVARERAAWDAQKQAAGVPAAPAAVAASSAPQPAAAAPLDAAPPAPPRDDAWIETARCPSCNECQTINPRMFAYNENKQAYIKDITAGTYRQLVEAAEACQVAIIHPGLPRDPNEPGLSELLERAAPFR
jgi:ferredoxin